MSQKSMQSLQSFPAFFLHRFVQDRLLQTAAGLAYTTLLSLVPLTVVVFALIAAFPVFDSMSDQIKDFIFSNFVPASGAVVQEHLSGFADKASRLTSTGILFLVLAAILLIATIDQAFNTIWHARHKRNPLYGFMMYWALLTLAPLLIGVSIAATSYIVSMPLLTETADTLGRQRLLRATPFLLSAVAFTLLYAVVPNTRVRLRHALPGGLLAAGLFEVAKRGFAFFVTNFPTYEMIYGALAAMPIFLIWIYLSWLIALTGAEFTYCLGVRRRGIAGQVSTDFVLAFRLIGHLVVAQRTGSALSLRRLQSIETGYGDADVEEMLDVLAESKLVHRTESGRWAFSRPAAELSLADIYHAGEFVLPPVAPEGAGKDDWNLRLDGALRDIDSGIADAMSATLDQLYASGARSGDDPVLPGDGEPPALRSV